MGKISGKALALVAVCALAGPVGAVAVVGIASASAKPAVPVSAGARYGGKALPTQCVDPRDDLYGDVTAANAVLYNTWQITKVTVLLPHYSVPVTLTAANASPLEMAYFVGRGEITQVCFVAVVS